MILLATNLRKDYKYLYIVDFGVCAMVVSMSKNEIKENREKFRSIKGAKKYCTEEIQNPKWGNNYPKLNYEKIQNEKLWDKI